MSKTSDHSRNNEDPRHQQAFELYLSQGPKRSYRRVAQQMGLSTSTIKLWSRTQGWRDRIVECEVRKARQLADSTQMGPDPENVRNLKIVHAALMRIAKAIAEGRVPVRMGDLERMVRLEEHLTGTHGLSPQQLARYIEMIKEVESIPPEQMKDEVRRIALDWGVIRREELVNDENIPEATR